MRGLANLRLPSGQLGQDLLQRSYAILDTFDTQASHCCLIQPADYQLSFWFKACKHMRAVNLTVHALYVIVCLARFGSILPLLPQFILCILHMYIAQSAMLISTHAEGITPFSNSTAWLMLCACILQDVTSKTNYSECVCIFMHRLCSRAPTHLLHRLLCSLQNVQKVYNPSAVQALANLAWSMAHLGFKHTNLLDRVISQLAWNADEINQRDLAEALSSLALLNLEPEEDSMNDMLHQLTTLLQDSGTTSVSNPATLNKTKFEKRTECTGLRACIALLPGMHETACVLCEQACIP